MLQDHQNVQNVQKEHFPLLKVLSVLAARMDITHMQELIHVRDVHLNFLHRQALKVALLVQLEVSALMVLDIPVRRGDTLSQGRVFVVDVTRAGGIIQVHQTLGQK